MAFDYKMEYKFKDYNGYTVILEKDDDFLLLIPDLIEDIRKKLTSIETRIPESDFNENGIFNNGYAIICQGNKIHQIIREDGSIINNLPTGLEIVSNQFYGDKLLVLGDRCYHYIDGKLGTVSSLPKEYSEYCAGDYLSGRIRLSRPNDIIFVDDNFKEISPEHYLHASNFAFGTAIVCTQEAWQVVDLDFKPLITYPRGEVRDDKMFLDIIKLLDEEAIKVETNTERKISENIFGGKAKYIDKTTGLSIFTPQIIMAIASELNLNVPEGNALEQLVWLINEVSKKDTYVFDTKRKKLFSVVLQEGIRVMSNKGSLVSYDEADVEFLRVRVKKEKSNE